MLAGSAPMRNAPFVHNCGRAGKQFGGTRLTFVTFQYMAASCIK